MDFGEQLPQPVLECLILVALVELADKMAAGLEGVTCELERGGTQVLRGHYSVRIVFFPKARKREQKRRSSGAYHAAGVVAKGHAARIHHPVRVTQRVQREAGALGPGC